MKKRFLEIVELHKLPIKKQTLALFKKIEKQKEYKTKDGFIKFSCSLDKLDVFDKDNNLYCTTNSIKNYVVCFKNYHMINDKECYSSLTIYTREYKTYTTVKTRHHGLKTYIETQESGFNWLGNKLL